MIDDHTVWIAWQIPESQVTFPRTINFIVNLIYQILLRTFLFWFTHHLFLSVFTLYLSLDPLHYLHNTWRERWKILVTTFITDKQTTKTTTNRSPLACFHNGDGLTRVTRQFRLEFRTIWNTFCTGEQPHEITLISSPQEPENVNTSPRTGSVTTTCHFVTRTRTYVD